MKTLSFVMALLLFLMPFLTLAQQTQRTGDAAQAIINAKNDAKAETNVLYGELQLLTLPFCLVV